MHREVRKIVYSLVPVLLFFGLLCYGVELLPWGLWGLR